MRLTQEIIFEKCRKFKVGDKIYIHTSKGGGSGGNAIQIKTPAVIVARYPNYLVTERVHGIKECFTYAEIATENVITKRVGRPGKDR